MKFADVFMMKIAKHFENNKKTQEHAQKFLEK